MQKRKSSNSKYVAKSCNQRSISNDHLRYITSRMNCKSKISIMITMPQRCLSKHTEALSKL